jgi:putative spermidine/putrescine transport system ATP-binding protein
MSEAVELDGLTTRYPGGGTIGPVSLSVHEGEMVSLLGPSGCGKTTVLRMLAGFVTPTAGTIRLRGRDVTRARPHRRGVALVFQNFALFPHLSVFDNIAFGPRRHGVAQAETKRRVERLIGQMRLDGLTARRPAALSGGQQQRVAIARALAIEPAVVLLDEPFSSLDTKLRESTRIELRNLQQEIGFTAILVTHDQGEALSMSDRVAVMQSGRLEQFGIALDIYHHPANRFVAGFVGRANAVLGGIVRPESIRILDAEAEQGIVGTVVSAAFHGGSSEIIVATPDGAQIVAAADGMAPSRHPPGSAVRLVWSPESVITFGESA